MRSSQCSTIRVFNDFNRSAEDHARILDDRRLCRETKCLLNTDVSYTSPQGLLEPKTEPVEEGFITSDFMYLFSV